jgi:hypothetical protein
MWSHMCHMGLSGDKWGHVESYVSYGAKWGQVGTSGVKFVKPSYSWEVNFYKFVVSFNFSLPYCQMKMIIVNKSQFFHL